MIGFENVPKSVFLKAALFSFLPILGIGLILVGMISADPLFQKEDVLMNRILEKDHSKASPEVRKNLTQTPITNAMEFYQKYHLYAFHFPIYCITGETQSEFQAKQCGDLLQLFIPWSLLAFSPLVLVLISIFLFHQQVSIFYQRALGEIKRGKPLVIGRVTEPPLASESLFSRLYCLQSVAVQLKTGAQVVAYLPRGVPIPLPGQKFALFDCGTRYGAKRYVGWVYAPHMVVVHGSGELG